MLYMRKIVILLAAAAAAGASQSQLNYELNALAGYDGSRFHYALPEQRPGVGVDYLQIISGEYGDVGRVNVQARLTADPQGRYEAPYVLTPFHGNENDDAARRPPRAS